MTSFRKYHNVAENALVNIQNFEQSGQFTSALDSCEQYFSKNHFKVWDSTNERIFEIFLKMAPEEKRSPEKCVDFALKFSDTNHDPFPEFIKSFLLRCKSRISVEVTRSQKELENCTSKLLNNVDLKKLVEEVIVNPAVDYCIDSYFTIVSKIAQIQRYEQLFHFLLKEGIEISFQYSNSTLFDSFNDILRIHKKNYETGAKGESINLIINSFIHTYLYSVKFKKFLNAMSFIDEVYIFCKKYSSSIETLRLIENYKIKILKILNLNLYVSILNKNINPTISTLIEAATAPITEEIYHLNINYHSFNIKQFLNETSSDVPQRSDLIDDLLHLPSVTTSNKILVEFIKAAEGSTDPYFICKQYEQFRKISSQDQIQNSFLKDLDKYASIRILERVRKHYKVITFPELQKLITWMNVEEIEDLIIDISRLSFIPAHVSSKNNSVLFELRGDQELKPSLSTLNVKLMTIFNDFQTIRQLVEDSVQLNTSSNNEIYKNKIYQNRSGKVKDNQDKVDKIIKNIEKEQIEAENKKANEKLAEEKKLREIEELKAKERKERIDKYDKIYIEMTIIASDVQKNLIEFLSEKSSSGKLPTKIKHQDLEYIEERLYDMKVLYIKNIRSASDEIQTRLNKEKQLIGKEKYKNRLLIKSKVLQTIEKEKKLIPAFIKFNNKERSKRNEEEINNFVELNSLTHKYQEAFENIFGLIKEVPKQQPMPKSVSFDNSLYKHKQQPEEIKKQPKDEIEKPKEEILLPKEEIIIPKEEVEIPKEEIKIPKEEVEIPKEEIKIPKQEIKITEFDPKIEEITNSIKPKAKTQWNISFSNDKPETVPERKFNNNIGRNNSNNNDNNKSKNDNNYNNKSTFPPRINSVASKFARQDQILSSSLSQSDLNTINEDNNKKPKPFENKFNNPSTTQPQPPSKTNNSIWFNKKQQK